MIPVLIFPRNEVTELSILINKDTKVVVQGITGRYGSSQVKAMLEYGTNIVAGVNPGKGGQEVFGVPVYDTVFEAMENHKEINAGIVYVPPMKVKDAVIEAIDAGIKVGMVAAEGVPLHDTMMLKAYAKEKDVWMVGPNTIGLITPGECLLGSLAAEYGTKGKVGIVTRGGTIAIELVRMLSDEGIGQSTCIGSGGDKVVFRNQAEYLQQFDQDDETEVIVLNGEIGGGKETECAKIIPKLNKKVFAYILGRSAPKGKRMGHIGAIVGSDAESWASKCEVLRDAGAYVVNTPWELIDELKKLGLNNK